MNRLVYNLSLAAGLLAVGVGVGMEFGVARSLAVVGLLVIALTLVGVRIGAR